MESPQALQQPTALDRPRRCALQAGRFVQHHPGVRRERDRGAARRCGRSGAMRSGRGARLPAARQRDQRTGRYPGRRPRLAQAAGVGRVRAARAEPPSLGEGAGRGVGGEVLRVPPPPDRPQAGRAGRRPAVGAARAGRRRGPPHQAGSGRDDPAHLRGRVRDDHDPYRQHGPHPDAPPRPTRPASGRPLAGALRGGRGAALRAACADRRPLRAGRRRDRRPVHTQGPPGAADVRGGQPRPGRRGRPGPLRRGTPRGADAVVRLRHPLLPRRRAGPCRGPGGAASAARPLRHMDAAGRRPALDSRIGLRGLASLPVAFS